MSTCDIKKSYHIRHSYIHKLLQWMLVKRQNIVCTIEICMYTLGWFFKNQITYFSNLKSSIYKV